MWSQDKPGENTNFAENMLYILNYGQPIHTLTRSKNKLDRYVLFIVSQRNILP